MRGVIGLLLIVVGLEVAYLVLAGKLPLQNQQTGATTAAPAIQAIDPRATTTLSANISTRPVVGAAVPLWSGLL